MTRPTMESLKARTTELIRLLEANGCILHDEWYPEPYVAKLRYTTKAESHDQMWELEIRPRVRHAPKADPS